MPVGAALIFLMAGPATNVATMGAILRGFGARILGIYLGTIVVCSVAAAQFYEQSFQGAGMQHTSHGDHTSPLAVISAVILLALLGRFAMDDMKRRLSGSAEGTQPVLEMEVGGMTCGGCVNRLTGLLEKIEGVDHVEVILEPGQARVYGTPEAGRVEEVIRNAGFSTA
jgi:copper chaperone CopZ